MKEKIVRRKIRLGVNLDHVVTLRQVRGRTTAYPDLLRAVQEAVKGGAHQITIHLREDRRHIQPEDVAAVVVGCPVPVNLEMAANTEMLKYCKKYRPDWACLVPEKRQELTTEGGLNLASNERRYRRTIRELFDLGVRVSAFIEPDSHQVELSAKLGAKAVEFHTGRWVHLKGPARKKEWQRLVAAAQQAHQLGLQVHAGHGLDYDSAREIASLPHLEELNIGHFLVCESVFVGMKRAVSEMNRQIALGLR